ncbi:molecular chaperone [Providencia rettgeri]|uniref:TorD/DmsD family molecular chaperone n=1 Tax=Providencia rettgeri TaxID=587 RepID=UPI0034E0DF91
MNNENPTLAFLSARQFAYDVLRRLLIEEPTPELLKYLREAGLALFPCEDHFPVMAEAITAMQKDLQARNLQVGTDDFEALHWDFTRLFIGPDAPPAPPWESTYVSRDKLLFQECTLAVKSFYKKYGFELTQKELEAADHIGYELDFMWNLSQQIVERAILTPELTDETKALLQASYTFLNDHLLAFITSFCRELHNHANTPFYRQLSLLLEPFLRNDQKQIKELVNL